METELSINKRRAWWSFAAMMGTGMLWVIFHDTENRGLSGAITAFTNIILIIIIVLTSLSVLVFYIKNRKATPNWILFLVLPGILYTIFLTVAMMALVVLMTSTRDKENQRIAIQTDTSNKR